MDLKTTVVKNVGLFLAFLTGLASVSGAREIPTDGLVAYYPFHGNALDASGNGNDGVVIGGTLAPDRFGREDSAYRFDGRDDWIEVENSPTLNIHGDTSLSICAWIYAESFVTAQGIVNKWGRGGAVDDQFTLQIKHDKVLFQLSDESSLTRSRAVLQTDTWYFIAAVYDWDAESMLIYGNGVLDNVREVRFSIWDKPQHVDIGREAEPGTCWHGRIDDVRVYNRALTQGEILELFHEGGWTHPEPVWPVEPYQPEPPDPDPEPVDPPPIGNPNWEQIDEAETPEGTWPQLFALDPATAMVVTPEAAAAAIQEPWQLTEEQGEFRVVAVTPDTVLYAYVEILEGRVYGSSKEFADGWRLMRSTDRGHTWVQVFLCPGSGTMEGDVERVLQALAVDPHNSWRIFIGTSTGLFLGAGTGHTSLRPPEDVPVALPYLAVNIGAMAMDPREPDMLYVASQSGVKTLWGQEIVTSLPGLYRGYAHADGTVHWEDIDMGLDVTILDVGLPPQDRSSIYLRVVGDRVLRAFLWEWRDPAEFGWEPVEPGELPPTLSFVAPPVDVQPLLRVPSGYVEAYLSHNESNWGMAGFGGYLIAQDGGVLFASHWWYNLGRTKHHVSRSRDGGTTWETVASVSHLRDHDFPPALIGGELLVDIRGESMGLRDGLPGIAAETVGPWVRDPVDPLTFCVATRGEKPLYRGYVRGGWTDVSDGLPLATEIQAIAVDSFSTMGALGDS